MRGLLLSTVYTRISYTTDIIMILQKKITLQTVYQSK